MRTDEERIVAAVSRERAYMETEDKTNEVEK
jgi:hypothetical protein